MTPDPDDASFRQSLREHWQVSPPRNPGFRTAVWARIEAGRRAPATWSGWLRMNLFRVSTFAAASIFVAGAGGGFLAQAQASRDREQLVERYLASIDPHQKTHADHP
jgi:hypothetical protein